MSCTPAPLIRRAVNACDIAVRYASVDKAHKFPEEINVRPLLEDLGEVQSGAVVMVRFRICWISQTRAIRDADHGRSHHWTAG
jgi:hypothetical protein